MKRFIKSITACIILAAFPAIPSWAQQPLGSASGNMGNGPTSGYQLGQPGTAGGPGNTNLTRQQQPANTASSSQAAKANAPGTTSASVAQNSAEIPWLRSATEAAIQSQKTGKPILVYVRSQNCHYCDLLQKNTWQDQATKERVLREMIPLKLTLEENKEAIEAMKVKGFPSVIIFSPRREYLGRIDGYVTPEQFQGQVAKAMLAHQTNHSAPVTR